MPGKNLSNASDSLIVIFGEPASKANSRRLIKPGLVIKSKKAMDYIKAFEAQCPVFDPLLTEDVAVWIKIWYASRRPDLDESLVLDLLQGKVYANDRQVKEKHILWDLDKDNPRAAIMVGGRDDPTLEGRFRSGIKGLIL